MAHHRHHWLLIRLAAQNVGRRRLRAICLGAAVMLGVGIGFASFVAGWALHEGIATSFSRMGADLVAVPRATLVNITSSLLTVQPTDETLPADLAKRIADVPGIARVAPQRIVPALVEGRGVNLIAFDPAHDFSVLTWLEQRQPGPVEGLIAGGGLAAKLGATLSVCGLPLSGLRPARARPASVRSTSPISSPSAHWPRSFRSAAPRTTRNRGEGRTPAAGGNRGLGTAGSRHEPCLLARRSARPRFGLPAAALAGSEGGGRQIRPRPHLRLKLVEGNTVLISSRQALSTLLIGIAVFTAFQLVALLILVCAAVLGDRPGTLAGSRPVAGDGCEARSGHGDHPGGGRHHHRAGRPRRSRLRRGRAADVRPVARLLLRPPRHPFSWPPLAVLQTGAIVAIVFSAILGLVGAFLPAWRVRRMAPYELIQSEGR